MGLVAEDRKRKAAAPVSSLSGPGPPPSASRPRVSSCNGPLTTSPSPSHTFPSWSDETEERRLVNKEDLVAEERRPEREGELLSRAPLFHLRLSSVLGTATSLTDQLTDTSTPTLTSRQLQRLPNNS